MFTNTSDMTKSHAILLPAVALLSTLATTGCNRSSDQGTSAAIAETIVTRELAVLESETTSEEIETRLTTPSGCFSGPFNGAPFGAMWPECASIVDSGLDSDPRTIAVSFEDGCTGPQGNPLSGTMTIEIVGAGDSLLAVGDGRTITHEDFQRGNRVLNGTRSRFVSSIDENNQPTFDLSHDMTMAHPFGEINQSGGGTWVWLSGFGTPGDCSDNIWVRNFEANWTGPQGNGTTRILDGLTYDGACGYVISGTITINRPNQQVVIDFGDGECDHFAIVNHNGNLFELNLETHEISPI